MLTKKERFSIQFVPRIGCIALVYVIYRACHAHEWGILVIDVAACITIMLLSIAFEDYITKERRRIADRNNAMLSEVYNRIGKKQP